VTRREGFFSRRHGGTEIRGRRGSLAWRREGEKENEKENEKEREEKRRRIQPALFLCMLVRPMGGRLGFESLGSKAWVRELGFETSASVFSVAP
jgi:hypothetical protein